MTERITIVEDSENRRLLGNHAADLILRAGNKDREGRGRMTEHSPEVLKLVEAVEKERWAQKQLDGDGDRARAWHDARDEVLEALAPFTPKPQALAEAVEAITEDPRHTSDGEWTRVKSSLMVALRDALARHREAPDWRQWVEALEKSFDDDVGGMVLRNIRSRVRNLLERFP